VSEAFYLMINLANQSLFFSGLFPEHIHYRERTCAAPGLKFYEQIGRSQYYHASLHRIAVGLELASPLNTLSNRFEKACQALNLVSDSLIFLNTPSPSTAPDFSPPEA